MDETAITETVNVVDVVNDPSETVSVINDVPSKLEVGLILIAQLLPVPETTRSVFATIAGDPEDAVTAVQSNGESICEIVNATVTDRSDLTV